MPLKYQYRTIVTGEHYSSLIDASSLFGLLRQLITTSVRLLLANRGYFVPSCACCGGQPHGDAPMEADAVARVVQGEAPEVLH